MDFKQVLTTLITVLLTISLILTIASAYKQQRTISTLVNLSDVSSSIITRLTTEEMTFVDPSGEKQVYVIDADKAKSIPFKRTIGSYNFEFQMSILTRIENYEFSIGTFGPAPPNDRPTCSIDVSCAIWMEGRLLPAKLRVIVWMD
jgi:hypothetical protein